MLGGHPSHGTHGAHVDPRTRPLLSGLPLAPTFYRIDSHGSAKCASAVHLHTLTYTALPMRQDPPRLCTMTTSRTRGRVHRPAAQWERSDGRTREVAERHICQPQRAASRTGSVHHPLTTEPDFPRDSYVPEQEPAELLFQEPCHLQERASREQERASREVHAPRSRQRRFPQLVMTVWDLTGNTLRPYARSAVTFSS